MAAMTAPADDWLRAFFEQSEDVYALLDADGTFNWLNDAGERFFGYTRQEVAGRHFRDYLVQGEPSGQTFLHAVRGDAGSVLRHLRRGDGTIAPVKAELLPVGEGRVLAHATDMREVMSDLRALRSSTVLDALLASTSEVVLLLDASLCLVHFSDRAAALLGQITGHELRADESFRLFAPNGDAAATERLVASAFAGQPVAITRELTDLDGQTRIFRVHLFALAQPGGPPLGVAVIASEVTAEAQAQARAERYLNLLTHGESVACVGSWVYRPATGEVEWTPGLYEVFDLQPDSGPDLEALLRRVHPDDRERVAALARRRLEGDEVESSSRYRVLLDSGQLLWLDETVVVERNEDGDVVTMIGTMQDVSLRVAAAQHGIQVEKDRALKFLVSGIAHDLNNHLQGVIGALSLFRANPSVSNMRWLERADRSAMDAAEVVAGLRTYVGTDPEPRTTVALHDLVRQSLRFVDLTGVDVTLALDSIEVVADAADIGAAIAAIIENGVEAARHAAAGGDAPTLRITLQSEGEDARLTVEDNGIGMDSETLASAFDPYFTTKQGQHLAGLGLAVAYQVVQRHHGSIVIDSRLHAGTRVTVTIPQQSPETPRADAQG